MDFQDTNWIRIYVHDTVNWLNLPWQAQGLLVVLLRKLDRAGLLPLDGHDPAAAVAAVTGWPLEVCETYLPMLMQTRKNGDHGTFVVVDDTLVCPNYVIAQRAQASSSARSRDCRARRRASRLAQTLNLPDDYPLDLLDDGELPEATQRCGSAPTAASGNHQRRGRTERIDRDRDHKTQKVAPVDEHVDDSSPYQRIYVLLRDARKQLGIPNARRLPDTSRNRGMIDSVMGQCGAEWEDWDRVVLGQLYLVRQQPRENWHWLSLEALADPRNFNRALAAGEQCTAAESRAPADPELLRAPPPDPPPTADDGVIAPETLAKIQARAGDARVIPLVRRS